jgi:Na+/proline symporter/CheY-like chemotaxis protein/nitrogen-specific signal transduction histidine kinase
VVIGWIAVILAITYIGILFAIAYFGDRAAARGNMKARPAVYALALSVYCTSWTFFGSVGLAATSGLDFLPIYIGPILMFTLGYPVLRRVLRLSKEERITSIADFIGARYGKSEAVAVAATVIAVIGAVPYIALQLKAVSSSVATLVPELETGTGLFPVFGDIALLVALSMALFAILFGTRHADATEHQNGMMLAVAAEAVVKLAAFVVVGVFVTFFLFEGPFDLARRTIANPELKTLFSRDLSGGTWLTMTVLAFVAALLLPRQFHIAVVENNAANELRRATWMFPAYLVAINLFVVPIAVAGILTFGGEVNADLFVLELPHASGNTLITLIAFIGGLSAATAMVIVASVALAIMISNEIVVPAFVRRRASFGQPFDMGRFILHVRRISIILILFLGYAYYRIAGSAALAAIGLLSFAAIAQLAPAFFIGLFWRRASARGAIAGMAAGLAVWAYTLLLPTFVTSDLISPSLLESGPYGISFLRPQALFNFAVDPLPHGVFWSLLANIAALVAVSLARPLQPIERLQAQIFIPLDNSPVPTIRSIPTSITVGELRDTVARYLGEERTLRSFERLAQQTGQALEPKALIDLQGLRFAEQLLASAIGAASSRLVLSLLISRDDPSTRAAHHLLDDATEALHYNRGLLQTAIDQMTQGIALFDADLRLTSWNRRFRQLLSLPPEFGQVGSSLRDILRHLAHAGMFGPGEADIIADRRVQALVAELKPSMDRHPDSGLTIQFEPQSLAEAGLAITFTDVTARIETEAELNRAKATLEKRVMERTAELTRLNEALEKANAAAEEANIGKTRFIAAAGHDLLQPLNAARLYATALSEKLRDTANCGLATDMETALGSVEDIFRTMIKLSRLDTGQLKPDIQIVQLESVLNNIRVEFEPLAQEKSLSLVVVPCSLSVKSDPQLLVRLVGNLVSNAIKYTANGQILVGCRRKRDRIVVEILDSGMGIAIADQKVIYREFQRLDAGARAAPGLGLGLSIVERLSKVLKHPVRLDSVPGRGSRFSVELPRSFTLPETAPRTERSTIVAGMTAGIAVLCIDNDEKILSGMQALLSGWGAQVLTARSAREAVKLLKRMSVMPGVMLVDYHLDDGIGLAAVAEIRWKFGDHIPAVLITADRSGEVAVAAKNAGIRILHKPLKPAALRALLAQLNVSRPAAE